MREPGCAMTNPCGNKVVVIPGTHLHEQVIHFCGEHTCSIELSDKLGAHYVIVIDQ